MNDQQLNLITAAIITAMTVYRDLYTADPNTIDISMYVPTEFYLNDVEKLCIIHVIEEHLKATGKAEFKLNNNNNDNNIS